jgi:thioredoxin reductase (NADPH)
MNSERMDAYQLVIIGSGPAGLTAAIYAARAQLRPLVVAGPEPGGQLTLTTDVEDFPGFPEGVQGPELMERMRRQAERFGAAFLNDAVTAVDLRQRPFQLSIGERTLTAQSVIVATGAAARWLNLPSEQRLIGHGVSSCAVCDGYFFKGQDVIVVGGGDSALREALYLSKLARSVTVVHRRDALRAQKILQQRSRENPTIRFRLNAVVEEVLGEDAVSGVTLRDTVTGERVAVECRGVFIAIGHVPNTAAFRGALELDQAGYVVSSDGVRTSVGGVFVAGDVHDQKYRQAVTAAGAGCAAAMEAEEYLERLRAQ